MQYGFMMIDKLEWEVSAESRLQKYKTTFIMMVVGVGVLLFGIYANIPNRKSTDVIMGMIFLGCGMGMLFKKIITPSVNKKCIITLEDNTICYEINNKEYQFSYHAITQVTVDNKNLILQIQKNVCQIPLSVFEKMNIARENFIEVLTKKIHEQETDIFRKKKAAFSSLPRSKNYSAYFVFAVIMMYMGLSGATMIVDDVIGKAEQEDVPTWEKVIAFYALKVGAGLGDRVQQTNLGYLYLQGRIIPRDEQKFLYWTTRAAAQGDHTAEYNLAIAYKDQHAGLLYDEKQVLYWLNRSAAGGYEKANELLTQLSSIDVAALAKTISLPMTNFQNTKKNSSDDADDVDFDKDLQDDPAI
jgi:hypothetical protein